MPLSQREIRMGRVTEGTQKSYQVYHEELVDVIQNLDITDAENLELSAVIRAVARDAYAAGRAYDATHRPAQIA